MKTYSREELLSALGNGRFDFPLFSEDERAFAASFSGNEKMREELFAFAASEKDKPNFAPTFGQFARYDTDGDRDAFEDDLTSGYFVTRHRLAAFTLMVWLYGQDEYLIPLENTVWAVLGEYSWSLPAHMANKSLTRLETDGYTVDLYASMTAQDLSEILKLLGDKLHPLLVARVKREIKVRVFDSLYGERARDFWWLRTKCNWAAVCGGNVGMTAIALVDDDEKLADMLLPVLDTMRCFLSGFSDDGVCHEGIGYWTYGLGYFTSFADSLYKRTNGKIDLFDDEKVKRISAFPPSCLFEGGLSLPFSDAWKFAKVRPGMMNYVARRFPDLPLPSGSMIKDRFEVYSSERMALDIRDFLWCGTAFPADTFAPFSAPYPNAQWYIARAKNGVTFMAKAGNNAESHNQNDVGNFAVCQKGVPFFWDIGAGVYCRQYLTDTWRYEFIEAQSRGHSVPIVDGQGQKNGKMGSSQKDCPYAAKNVEVRADGMSADIADAYGIEGMSHLVRNFVFDRESGKTELTDAFTFDRDGVQIVERFISVLPPEKTAGGAVVGKDGVRLAVRDSLGTEPRFSSEKRITVYGEEPDGDTVYFTDFVYTAEKEFKIAFTFTAEGD